MLMIRADEHIPFWFSRPAYGEPRGRAGNTPRFAADTGAKNNTVKTAAPCTGPLNFLSSLSIRLPAIRIFVFILLFLFGAEFRCFAQDAISFNDALRNILSYLTGRISAGSTVAVLNFQSDYPNLSEYVIDDIISGLVNTDLFTVVDRRSLELLEQEMAFQLSGEVSDETALAIGKKLGAQMVISGAVSYLGEFYRLRVQAIEVETARIQGSQTATIRPDRLLATLTGNPWTGPVEPEYIAVEEEAVPVIAETDETAPAPARTQQAPARASNTKIFYLGLRGGFSLQMHQPNGEFLHGHSYAWETSFSWEASAQMSLQAFSFLAVQAEAVFFKDTFPFELEAIPVTFSYYAMMLPILGKITFRPGIFLFAGFGGVYFTVPLSAMTFDYDGTEYLYNFTAPMGFIGGGNFGVKLGPGTLFLDIRYAGDFEDTVLQGDWGSRAVYKRSLVTWSLGYEFGFGNR
jgi:TolB-like protein